MNQRLTLSLILALSQCPAFAADKDVVARLGELALTEADVRALVRERPPGDMPAGELERLVRTELIRRAVAAEARRQAFDKKPEVAARMERAAEQALVTGYMNGIAQPPAGYPSAELLKQAYEANKEALALPPRLRLSQIYLDGVDDKTRKQAEDLAREARRKGADFAALARKSSRHAASAAKGGDMGWLAESELAPAFRQALAGLDAGAVSAPVAGAGGFHVLKVVERKAAEIQPFDQVRDSIARNLRLRKAAEIEQAYLDALLARNPLAVNGIALEALGKR